jgi:L-lysine 6-transaminase
MKTSEIIPSLQKSILVDGFDILFDHEKSRGSKLWDAKNERYLIDFFSFFASNPIGFNHPDLKHPEFEKELLMAAKVKISNSDVYSKFLAEFIDFFHKNFCPMFDRLFFVEGGALGVENAIKAAQDWKVRKNLAAGRGEIGGEVMHFKQAFHGRSGYTLSLTNTVSVKTAYFPKFDWPRITNPKLKFPISAENLEETLRLEAQAMVEMKSEFVKRKHRICSIIIEPIQGEGGDHFFRKEFLQSLKELSLENDCLLIFDEVQTGLGITGKRWAFEHFEVQPDLMAFGKKVQVGGFAAKLDRLQEVDHVFKIPSRINSTWGGNLTDMRRSLEFMKIILKEDLLKNAEFVGVKMKSELESIAVETKKISNVRGLGLWIAFDFETPQIRDAFFKDSWNNGLMLLKCGDLSIRLRPLLNLTEEEADEGLNLIRKTLNHKS